MEEPPTPSHIQRLLAPLRESIVDKPPYTSGTLRLPTSCFSLFYNAKKDGTDTRHVNLANAIHDELEQLTQACDPATFGQKQKEVLDETYRKAGKMDPDRFASPLHPSQTDLMKIIRGYLLEGTQSSEYVSAELHKLNVYSKGSFFKPHVDTPRDQKMFGSLVVIFPTTHEGGALLLRHRGHEWTFKSNQEQESKQEPSISYVAFFSDVEHEVTPVVSGHRVTLTYNLYFGDSGRTDSSKDAVSEYLSLPPAANDKPFREAFRALLENPEFLPDGGTLAFDMRHVYLMPETYKPDALRQIYGALKGSDAVVYQIAHALGFQPVLYLDYRCDAKDGCGTAVSEKVIDFTSVSFGYDEEINVVPVVLDGGGIAVVTEGDVDEYGGSERVEWVTPESTLNVKKSQFAT